MCVGYIKIKCFPIKCSGNWFRIQEKQFHPELDTVQPWGLPEAGSNDTSLDIWEVKILHSNSDFANLHERRQKQGQEVGGR